MKNVSLSQKPPFPARSMLSLIHIFHGDHDGPVVHLLHILDVLQKVEMCIRDSITAFSPAQSPPLVSIPTFIAFSLLQSGKISVLLTYFTIPVPVPSMRFPQESCKILLPARQGGGQCGKNGKSGGAYCPAASALQVVGVLHGRAAVGGDARITAVRVIGRPVRLPPLSALYLQDFVPLEEPQFFALCALFAEPALLCVLSGCAEPVSYTHLDVYKRQSEMYALTEG